jgi:hypothetical protein
MSLKILILFSVFMYQHGSHGIPERNPGQTLPDFQVSILYTIQPEGFTLNYIISGDSLKLHYKCLFTRCRDTTIYRIRLQTGEASAYYQYVRTLRLDSLQNFNETKGDDRVSALVRIQCPGMPPQSLLTVHVDQPVIAMLISRTNNLIPDLNYRYVTPQSHLAR